MQKHTITRVMLGFASLGLLAFACAFPTPQPSPPQATLTHTVNPSETVSATPPLTPTTAPTATAPPPPAQAPEYAHRIVGYFTGVHANNLAGEIPGAYLTDIIYASVIISPEGRCVSRDAAVDQANFAAFQQLKVKYPALHILFTIGEGPPPGTFANATASEAARQVLVQSCVQFLQQNGFDGIDIDWEFPARGSQHPEERENFTAMLAEFRTLLNAQGQADGRAYLLTFAAPAGQNEAMGFELDKVHPLVDWINLMTYNYYDENSITTNLDGALYPVAEDPGNKTYNDDSVVQYYLAAGVPSKKLMLGTNFYGHAWKGVPPDQNGLYQPHQGAFNDPNVPEGTWNVEGKGSYQAIQQYYLNTPGWNSYWQAEAQATWLYNAEIGAFITYHDPQSLAAKADYVIGNQLGGVMVWQIGADDPNNALLKALAARLMP